MKSFIFISAIIILNACTTDNSNNSNSSSEEIDEKQIAEATQKGKPQLEVKTKTELDLLFEDGLIVADSSEQCASKKWAVEPRIKLLFNYPNGNKLILEEWEYSLNRNDEELRLLDFHIFNCHTGEILLEAQYTVADYKIVDVKPSLKIQINADIPILDEGYSRQPFVIKTFKEVDSTIITEVERVFNIPDLSNQEIIKIESDYNSRPILGEEKKLEVGDFASGELILSLFRGAINRNDKALDLFYNIEKKYALDGGVAELYGDLYYLLNEAGNKYNSQ
jgi:hypothetical protein